MNETSIIFTYEKYGILVFIALIVNILGWIYLAIDNHSIIAGLVIGISLVILVSFIIYINVNPIYSANGPLR